MTTGRPADDAVDDFRRDGVTCIRGLVDSDQVAKAASGIDAVLARPSSRSTAQRTPWHQDQPYYNVSGRQTVSFWIPVDPVPVDGSLEVVAGTHDGPWLLPRTFLDEEARWFPEGSLDELPDIEADRTAFPIRSWAREPGDAIAFHFLSVHGAAGAELDHPLFPVVWPADTGR